MSKSPVNGAVFESMLRRQLIDSWKVQYSSPLKGTVSDFCLVIAKQTPMLEELSGSSKLLSVLFVNAIC